LKFQHLFAIPGVGCDFANICSGNPTNGYLPPVGWGKYLFLIPDSFAVTAVDYIAIPSINRIYREFPETLQIFEDIYPKMIRANRD
jgi:hypothetical protein